MFSLYYILVTTLRPTLGEIAYPDHSIVSVYYGSRLNTETLVTFTIE